MYVHACRQDLNNYKKTTTAGSGWLLEISLLMFASCTVIHIYLNSL